MSDSTDLGIILIILVGTIVYFTYIRKLIDANYDINNIKCNPVTMFLKSINADVAESTNDFAECVQLFTPSSK
jgi:hypothetical protein